MIRPLTEYDIPAFRAELEAAGHRPVHAVSILRAFYRASGRPRFAADDFGNRVCNWLAREVPAPSSAVRSRAVSSDGTVKLLVGYPDGGAVESVLMPAYRDGRAMGCVSSQIGCAMGCDFCASTRGGLERSLSAGEIVEQFLHLSREAAAQNRKLTSIVFMGMGEPMHNLDAVIGGIGRIGHPDLGAVGWRQITVSTVGIVPGIDRLAAADLNVHLALSLHAPDDETRARLVPSNKRYPIAEIVEAAKRFYEKSGRIVTIEYCMLAGVNDSDDHARALAELLNGFRAHVNLIPYNTIGAGLSGAIYQRPERSRVGAFLTILRDAGIVAHARDTRGDDVNAACGQLRQQLVTLQT